MVQSNGRATRDSEALRYLEFHEIRCSCANITSLGEPRLVAVSRVTKYRNRSHARDDANNEVPAAQRSFAQPAACLQVRAAMTPEPTKRQGRKPRASERHAVGCCEELCRGRLPKTTDPPISDNKHTTRCCIRA